MRLTNRDIQIFHSLLTHRYMTTALITMRFFSNRKRASRRLKKLVDDGWLGRFRVAVEGTSFGGELAFFLSAKSAAKVAIDLDVPLSSLKWRVTPPTSSRYIDHFTALNRFRIVTETSAEANDLNYKFLPEYSLLRSEHGRFSPEIKSAVKGKAPSFVPDGVMCLSKRQGKGKRLLFFVEVDRGTEAPSVVLSKVRAYCRYYDSRGYEKYDSVFHAQFQGFRLLLVCNDSERQERLFSVIKDARIPDIGFVWISHDAITAKGCLSERAWRVPGEKKMKAILG